MRWSLAVAGIFVASIAVAQTVDDHERDFDEAVLRARGLPTKGPDLLKILRDHTPTEETVDQFNKRVSTLRATTYTERLKATNDLSKMGPVVRPLLENLLRDLKADAETMGRLRLILKDFAPDEDIQVTMSAARLLARKPAPGSLPVLLDFVPYAPSEQVRREVQRAIDAVALVDKKPAPELEKALSDSRPARRAAAGEALVRTLGDKAKDDVAKLLKDPHPLVRYQLGTALVEKHDKNGLPMLIASVAELPAERAEYALDLLYRVAGDKGPSIYYKGKTNAIEVAAAWKKWHDKNGADVDIPKQLSRPEIGHTIISATGLAGAKGGKNRVFDLGPDKSVRWEFEGPRSALDIQVIGPNRLLMAEYFDRRVTERDFKGNLLKEFTANLPVACQRLPNGHTFIVTRQQLVIVDTNGKEIFTWSPQPATIITAQRLHNGQFVVISGGRCMLLDPQGHELKNFVLNGTLYAMGGTVEVLNNGRILVPLYNQNAVVEFDWTGAKLWTANVARPTAATRLANGNTLVTCTINSMILELDREGHEVWSYQTEGSRPHRARPR